ncbi:histidine kinase N-terminal 7TM domain-containing protein [Metabacillus litoralis]|uniref:histidine kinase N-terminal 7TM domain-containing diguanylate cyclase n=1 Tax=Metabacillus litoralis TaxID=152268 RepID=UPI002041D804|nr:histidine kinase N-terminal 7TM domain-containing protein [Metabacillus litoralis]MCM3161902.1 diguanylate cyclase [Metabacillus litoralis]
MNQELVMYILISVLGGSISIFLCGYGLVKIKDAPGGRYYVLATFMCAVFAFGYAFELASTTLEQMKIWLRVEYLALPFIPVFILLMCFDYVGKKLKQWAYILLFGIPILTITMHYTNEFHHIYYTSMDVRTDTPFPVLQLEGGPWFYIHSIFLYVCIVISVGILLMQFRKVTHKFRLQTSLMIAGLLVPVMGSVFYITDTSPSNIDLGPVSMSITFILHGFALLSFQMFNVVPIAREIVFESIEEGVIVLNQHDVIVDYNSAIVPVLPLFGPHAIGKAVRDVLNDHPLLLDLIFEKQEGDYQLKIGDVTNYFYIKFSPVKTKQSALIGKIITLVNVTERVNMEKKLKELASIDGLTKIYNRTYFLDKASAMIKDLSVSGGYLSIIMFDIDHFKMVNDRYGHDAGDQVLIDVAALTKEYLRNQDLFARYGGEEFIICMPDTTGLEAYELVDNLRKKVSESFTIASNNKIHITSSYGISTILLNSEKGNLTIQELMRQADQALYAAKRHGRNCVQVYEKEASMFN